MIRKLNKIYNVFGPDVSKTYKRKLIQLSVIKSDDWTISENMSEKKKCKLR